MTPLPIKNEFTDKKLLLKTSTSEEVKDITIRTHKVSISSPINKTHPSNQNPKTSSCIVKRLNKLTIEDKKRHHETDDDEKIKKRKKQYIEEMSFAQFMFSSSVLQQLEFGGNNTSLTHETCGTND